MKANLTDQERRVLISLHMQGFVHWGSMKKSKRVEFLNNLIARKLLDEDCHVTQLGIDSAAPDFNHEE